MIPKKIHYCWFGGKEKPKSVLEYIETWKKFLPDYEIKEWNEENFDVNKFSYTKEAYYAKKYAFVSDVARLYALVNEGGIYFDTDVKVLQRIPESFLEKEGFMGFENNKYVGTAVIASIPSHPLIKSFYDDTYRKANFFKKMSFNLRTNVCMLTDYLVQRGLVMNDVQQEIDGIVFFPQVFFSAKRYKTGEYYNTEETYMIHDFSSTWIDAKENSMMRLKKRIDELLTILKYNIIELKIR